jgi:hypothetical protein
MKNLILVLLILVSSAHAQKVDFNLSAVPETLKAKANVITLFEQINLEVESLDKASIQVQKIFTVLNEEGKGALLFNEYSSKTALLDEAEIKVYDQNGKQVQRYKKKDMVTVAVGEGLIEEGYVVLYEVTPSFYPITVEYNYTHKLKSTLMIPDYRFINNSHSVVESNFTATVPAEIGLTYRARNCNLVPEISDAGKNKVYKWSVKNLPAFEDEEGSVAAENRFPHVSIVAPQFSHYGFKGDLSSWKAFGSWINTLYKGLDELSSERQVFFKQMVADSPSEIERVRRIYKYMQENFRYVSIQLGIGGLQPFSATFTDQKKYGDCKALSNFMKAALQSVGIRSHVAVINAAYNLEPVDPSFPSSKFNHVILCVPQAKDSIWLECTSSTAEFGELGTFTENRNALLITEEGGVLVPTPSSKASANVLSTHTTLTMANDLSVQTHTRISTSGEYREMIGELLKEKYDDQKEAIIGMGYRQPDYFVLSDTGTGGKYHADLHMNLRKLTEFNSGDKHFLAPRIHKIWSRKLPAAENRKLDYFFRYPFEKQDTTVLKLPADYVMDVLPLEKGISLPYATYKAKTWFNAEEKSIYTTTTLILKNHRIAAADYAKVKSFFDEVAQDEAQRIVLKRIQTSPPEKKAF